ncbi:TonB-dependent receptor [Sphingomonadaceae bacterium jetA1]|jgi:TonB-dependent receptor|uniref:TonB-dependent receptor n=1 Tax=Facivitalis istanbulensis TaxID=3075838 RepID=UPI003482FF50
MRDLGKWARAIRFECLCSVALIAFPGMAHAAPLAVSDHDALGTADANPADAGAGAATDPSRAGQTIVVTGRRNDAEKLSIAADHKIDILDADALARAPDSNAAEALARLPGIALLPVTVGGALGGSAFMIDDAARGEGGYISVRGLGSDYTLNLMNGADIAQGKPATRQVSLALLPPLGFARIAVSKSLSPTMNGDAIAGVVDFQDASAFDIGKPLTMLSVQGAFNGNNDGYGLFKGPLNAGGTIQGEVSRVFGNGDFGIHAVGYYAKRNFSSSALNENEGNWDFLTTLDGSDHTPIPNLAPTANMIAEQINAQLSYGTTTRWGGNMALDWKRDETLHVYLRGSYAQADTEQTTIQRGPQSTSQNAVQNSDGTYTTLEQGIIGSYWAETNPERARLGNLQLGVDATFDRLSVKALAFGSYASDDRPNHIEMAYKNLSIDPTVSMAPGFAGNPAYPVPGLGQAVNTQINTIGQYVPQTLANFGSAGVVRDDVASHQLLGGAKLDLAWSTGLDWLPKIEFGAKYSTSHRRATSLDYQYDAGDALLPGLAPTLDGSPFIGRVINSPMLGGQAAHYPYATPLFNAPAALQYVMGLPLSYASAGYGYSWTGSPTQLAFNQNVNTQSGNERVTALYARAPITLGQLEITPGLRFEHTDISNTFWSATYDDNGNLSGGGFATNHTHYNVPLPSLFITWRPESAAVFRAAYWRSYVRPSLFLLGGGRTITPLGNNIIQIQQGNPNLVPVTAHNFDASIEYGLSDTSRISVAGFYKKLSNYLFDAGASTRGDGTHYVNTLGTSTVGSTIVLQPQNGGDASAYGVEFAVAQRLAVLPGFLSNFVVSGNMTLQHTSADLNLSGIANGGPMQYAPDFMANAALSYRTDRFESTLSYRHTGRFLETYYTYRRNDPVTGAALPNIDISWWDQPTERLDWSGRLRVRENVELNLAVQNILGDVSYYATRGKNAYQIAQIVQPGRTILAGMSIRF